VPAPVCRTAEEAYQAGLRDGAPDPKGAPELAERIAALLAPLLEAAAVPRMPLLTVPEAAEQLGISRELVYQLMRRGELQFIQLPLRTGARWSGRRVEQAAVDAFIERHRVTSPTTPGGVPPVGRRR
jgi:excisionase family DNA binding protein